MTEHHFETHEPVVLHVELGKGTLSVEATETTETTVRVSGRDAESVEVDQDGDQISVIAPRQRGGFFGNDSRLDVVVHVPTGSHLHARTGSADVTVEGTLGGCGIKSGSGEVRFADLTGPGTIDTGSGDITIGGAHGELRIKSGSGDVTVQRADGGLIVSTGSGSVEVGVTHGPAAGKTGSGDFRVAEAHSDVSLVTASGDFVIGRAHRGKLTAKGASGDVQIGIPSGVPVWTDITTLSGSIHSTLQASGQPEPGADHVELRAKSASGDIVLNQV